MFPSPPFPTASMMARRRLERDGAGRLKKLRSSSNRGDGQSPMRSLIAERRWLELTRAGPGDREDAQLLKALAKLRARQSKS